MRNIDIDNYIFDYIICNKRILFWRFKDFPRDKDLENHIIDLGETELTQEMASPQRYTFTELHTASLWKHLDLPEAILGLYIPAIYKKDFQDKHNKGVEQVPLLRAVSSSFIDEPNEKSDGKDFTGDLGFVSQQEKSQVSNSKKISLIPHLIPHRSACAVNDQEIFFFSEDGKWTNGGIFYRVFDVKKIEIPFSYCSAKRYISCWNNGCAAIFYNTQYLDLAKAVILADDIALAAQRQRELVAADIRDIVWLSWYGDLQNYPWNTLGQKVIYFFAAPHSGLDLNDILAIAHEVNAQLQAVDAPELRLIFPLPSEVTHFYSPLFRDSLPLIIPISQLPQIQTDFAHEVPVSFDCFRKKIAPDCNRKAHFLISPFIRTGARTLIWGANDSGKRTWSLALSHAFVTGKAVLSRFSPPAPGVVLYFHEDNVDLTEDLERLNAFAPWNIREHTSQHPQLQLACSTPMLIRHPLKLKALNPQSHSDACNFVAYLVRVACAIQTDLPKMLILDSILAPLIKHPRELQLFIEAQEKQGWTILIQESSHIPTWRKILHCDSEIHLERTVSLEGWDIICRMASAGGPRQENSYRINLADPSQTVLQNAPCNRKRGGLLLDRSELKKKLVALFEQGAKGKEVAERLQITEAMVKKLKNEAGLSKKRQPRDSHTSAESIASFLSNAKR